MSLGSATLSWLRNSFRGEKTTKDKTNVAVTLEETDGTIINSGNPLPTHDATLSLSEGNVTGHTYVNVYGRNPDLDGAEDIWDNGGIYIPPTADRIHQIVSTSIEDTGSVLSSGTATGGSNVLLLDTGATFITDGVNIGDLYLNDTTQDHSLVESIDSETQITLRITHHGSSAADNVYRIVTPAGTGSAVIHVKQGTALDGTEDTQFVVLNGTTNVPTTFAYFRITRLHTHGAGSNDANVGTITATADTDGTITAQINPNNGQSLMAFFHVPRGKKGYITSIKATLLRTNKEADSMADVSLRTRLWGDNSDGTLIEEVLGISITGGQVILPYNPYKFISQETDVWLRCDGVTKTDLDMSASFDIILVDQ